MQQEKVQSLGCRPDTERTGLSLPLHHTFIVEAGLAFTSHTPEEKVNELRDSRNSVYLLEVTSPCALLGLRLKDSLLLPLAANQYLESPEAGGLLGGGDLGLPSLSLWARLLIYPVSFALDLGTCYPALPTIKDTVVEVSLG